MPRKGEARNIRPQVCPAVYDSRADASDRGRITEEPCAAKVARTVLKQSCDMKSSQSLLCSTCCPDTTRCPISGILRRCAGR